MRQARVSWWKRGLALLSAAVSGVVVYIVATLPAARIELRTALPSTVVYGAYHVHTRRSDGGGTVADVARAAARAGLKFVILTDHGDATRTPDAPAYLDGVLIVDAAEISTRQGHVVALGLQSPSSYPLGGEARDVIEDIHRLGGWAVAAHPDSPKPELRWNAWQAPYDGIEWLNADSEWRDETAGRLAATLLRSFVRGPESIAALFSRPSATIARWDRTTALRSVVALAALDAHARLTPNEKDPSYPPHADAFGVPGYEQMFRTLVQAVVLDRPFAGQAPDDATRLLEALRVGRTYSVVTATAGPATLRFTASQNGNSTSIGGRLDPAGGDTTFSASIPGAPDARLEFWRHGQRVQTGRGEVTFTTRGEPGALRVEAFLGDSSTPWIFSNPIYSGGSAHVDVPASPTVTSRTALRASGTWTIERASTSSGSFTVQGDELQFAYGLAGGPPSGQYAALVTDVNSRDGFGYVEFVARSDRPMRVSVQVRLLGGQDGRRWQRSVYLDTTPRHIVVPISELTPTGSETNLRPNVATVKSLLFVVDTVNSSPGTHGTISISKVALARTTPE